MKHRHGLFTDCHHLPMVPMVPIVPQSAPMVSVADVSVKLYIRLKDCSTEMSLELELCADVIVSAAACRSISVGGGAPPVQKNRRRRRGRPKIFFSKIHEKISFYPQNFLR